MVTCVRCKKSPVCFSESYLIVTRSVNDNTEEIRGKEKTVSQTVNESLSGAVTVGICKECHDKSAAVTVRYISFVAGIVGFVFPLMSHAGLLLSLGIGVGALLLAYALSYLYCFKCNQKTQAEDEVREHLKAYCTDAGFNQIRIFVPVGENYYINEFSFATSNKHLSKPYAKKLYNELIATGAWKEYIEKEAVDPTAVSPHL